MSQRPFMDQDVLVLARQLLSATHRAWRHFLTNAGTCICVGASALIVLAIAFPPWLAPYANTGMQRSVGRGTFFEPPDRVPYAQYAHIDYGRLAFEIVLIVASTAAIWLIVRALSDRGRSAGGQHSASLLDQIHNVASRAIVQGYRKVALERGCAPTAKTADREIVAIYEVVGTAFQKAAESRREHLSAGIRNFIVLKFLQIHERMGNTFLREHLEYEIGKYRDEGLRPDYQQELRIF